MKPKNVRMTYRDIMKEIFGDDEGPGTGRLNKSSLFSNAVIGAPERDLGDAHTGGPAFI